MQFHMCRIFIFLNIFLAYVNAEKNGKNKGIFVPTEEWQVVDKGTPIPKGLHIRHNFETGKTEAKLLVNEEPLENASVEQTKSLVVQKNEESIEPSLSEIPLEELNLKLQKIKSDEADSPQDEVVDIKNRFRSYQELKKEFESLSMNISTEMELLKNLFEQFVAYKDDLISETPDKLKIHKVLDTLDDLEYLIHQIDNAQVFTDMGGMTEIISPCLNSTSDEIKSEALRLLGATAQSNPKVQARALEFIPKLLHMLITNSKVEVKSRCLFALSSLLRQFPAAQKVFVDHGGLEVFSKILEGDQLQTQMRVMNLVNDLLIERRNIQEFTNEEQLPQRTKAYAITNFEQKLHEYCRGLSNLTKKVFRNVINRRSISQSDELLQVVVESISALNPTCEFNNYEGTTLLPLIESLLKIHEFDSKVHENQQVDRDLILSLEKLKILLNYSRDEL